MKILMQTLLALQKLQLDRSPLTPSVEQEIRKLRDRVPEPILGHFDRLIVRGKKGVALVRHGVCSECHLRLSSGTLQSLAHTEEVQICDNCGRYLLLQATEPEASAEPPPSRPAAGKSRKRTVAHAA